MQLHWMSSDAVRAATEARANWPKWRALIDLRAVNLELDAEEKSRQEGDLRVFGCTTVRWSRSRQQQFQDKTSSAAIEQARLLINWNKWRVDYMNTPVAIVFDKAVRKLCKVRQRMTDYAVSKAAEAVEADITGAGEAADCGCMALTMLQRWRVFTVEQKFDSDEVQRRVAQLTDMGDLRDMMEIPESWDIPSVQSKYDYVVRNAAGAFVRSVTPTDGHCLYRSVSEVMTGHYESPPHSP